MTSFPDPLVSRGVYIAGPMRGIPEHNFPLFYHVKDMLLALGYERVVCPPDITKAKFGGDTTRSPREYMREDLREMMDCDTICVLPGFHASTGAKLEVAIAMTLGFTFLCYYPPDPDGAATGPDGCIASFDAPDAVTIVDGYKDDHRLTAASAV